MKLVAFIVLGLAVSIVIYIFLFLWILSAFPHSGGDGSLWIPFLITIPISLLLGSIVTGFLSCPTLDTKWGMLGMTPGLYFLIPTSFSLYISGSFQSVGNILLSILFMLYWYLSSLAGVGLGYLLRAGIRH